jgi:hypothetical protein
MSAAPAPAARRTSPLVWFLVIVLGFFALGIAALVGTGFFIARHGPGYALAKLVAAANPNVEVVGTDDGARTITLRNRRNGKEVTLSFDDARRGRLHMLAEDGNGQRASLDIGGEAKLPAWVPAYPGSTAQMVFSARGESDERVGEAGNFTFTTTDAPSKVALFYEDEAKRLGMDVRVTARGSDASVIVADDGEEHRSMTVVLGSDGGATTVNVTYGRKR